MFLTQVIQLLIYSICAELQITTSSSVLMRGVVACITLLLASGADAFVAGSSSLISSRAQSSKPQVRFWRPIGCRASRLA